jgi:hypothetical protein
MFDFRLIKYVKEVEKFRSSLIRHCNNNGYDIKDNASLSQVTSVVTNINNTKEEGVHTIHFIDTDGNEFLPCKKVNTHDSFDLNSLTPFNIDPEYLEFYEWAHDAEDLSDITEDVLIMPRYRVKADDQGRRWTIVQLLLINNSYLSGTYTGTKTTTGQVFVDWGDGSPIEISSDASTSFSFTHNYPSTGFYVSRIYSTEDFSLKDAAQGMNTALGCYANIYMGDNLTKAWYCHSGPYINRYLFPPDRTIKLNTLHGTGTIPMRTLIIPENTKDISIGQIGYHNTGLRYFLCPKSSSFKSWDGNGLGGLEYIKLNFTGTGVTISNSYSSIPLKYIKITGNSITSIRIGHPINKFPDWLSQNLTSLAIAINTDKDITIPYNITSFTFMGVSSLRGLYILNPATKISANSECSINCSYLSLPANYSHSFSSYTKNIFKGLSITNLIDIANNLADLNSLASNTLVIPPDTALKLHTTYVTQEGTQSDKNNSDAITLLQYITNKNWTISVTG